MSNWKEVTVGDLAIKITKGTTPPKGKGFVENSGINYIKSDAIEYDGIIDKSKFVQIDDETHEKFKRSQLKENDILFSMAGNYLGKSGIVSSEMLPANTNQALAIIRLNNRFVLPKFIGYTFRQPNMIKYVNQMSAQSAQPNINFQEIASLPVNLPEKCEQAKIVNILDTLDQKILLLREQNQTLEELAQTLFKRWFVEFNFPDKDGKPYKDNGGKMIDSELGEIPEGWRAAYLNSFISDSIGGDYGKEEIIGNFTEKVTCLRGTDLPDMKTGLPERAPIRYLKAAKLKKCQLEDGDLVIEISGGTEGQSTGRAMYINKEILSHYPRSMTCVNFCRILRPEKVEFLYFAYLLLDFLYSRGVFFNLENGSTGIKNLDLKTLLNGFELSLPPSILVKKFHISVNGVFKKIQDNNKEIQTLTQLRDTLLPKLMSGELRVKN